MRRHLRVARVQAIGLLLLGVICHIAGVDEVALFTWICGGIMLLGE